MNEFVIKNGLIVESGTTTVTGSITATGGFTGSLFGTASVATSLAGGALTNFIEGFSSVSQSTSFFSASNAAATVNFAIIPKGSGSIIAAVPNGLITGGNARGEYSVDLQMVRNAANQVAARPYSVIAGGERNRISTLAYTHNSILGGYNNIISDYTMKGVIAGGQNNTTTNSDPCPFIGAGQSNTINSRGDYSGIVAGSSNTISQYGCFIGAGSSNSVNGRNSGIVSGESNAISGHIGNLAWTFIGGGNNNKATPAAYGTIGGGASNIINNTYYATIAGGANNLITVDYAFIGGGFRNSGSGQFSTVVGGSGSVASNIYSFVGGGNRNLSNNTASFVGGGQQNTGSGIFSSVIGGYQGLAYLYGQSSHAAGAFTLTGDSQESDLVARVTGSLSTGGTVVLSLDGTGTTNLIIPSGSNRVWNAVIKTVAVVKTITGTATGVTVGDSLIQNDTVLFKRIGGTSSVVGSNNSTFIADTSMATSTVTYSAGASQELVITFTAPTFTGGGTLTTLITSKIELVEVAY